MAGTFKETERSIELVGGRGAGKRTFLVFDDKASDGEADITDFSDVLAMINAGTIPDKGDTFGDGFDGLRCKDFRLTQVPGTIGGTTNAVFKCEYTYEAYSASITASPAAAMTRLPNEINYVETAQNIRAEFAPAYRANPSVLPDNGNPTVLEDIRGRNIDVNGTPVSVIRKRMDLTVTENLEVPNLGAFRGYRFSRNLSYFYGVQPGMLLYLGAQVRRIGLKVFQVTHTFAEDDQFHMHQVPVVDQDGDPVLEKVGDKYHAKEVHWVQPFQPPLLEFAGLSANFPAP